MCGIYGVVAENLSADAIRALLSPMGARLRHRGPDELREAVYGAGPAKAGLGFARLAILDLETGMQPIQSPADDTAIILNGQVYNYVELRSELAGEVFRTRGDAEVALHLYRRKGTDFLQDLNGMYAGAILDPAKRRLLLFRDRFGIKPLYFCQHEGRFVFASEIRPILEAAGLPRQLNSRRLATYFTYRYVPGSETLFQGIRKLPPGCFLDLDLCSGAFTVNRYWEYRLDRQNEKMGLEEAAEHFYALFSDAVRIRLRSDVEVGALISGGIDSSAVSARAAEFQPPLQLFHIAFETEAYNEFPFVRKFLEDDPARFRQSFLESEICREEALHELPAIVSALEEPISLGTILPTDQVCRMAARKVKTVLTGEGADEIFAGYRKFMIEAAAAAYADLPLDRRSALDRAYPELSAYRRSRHSDPARRYIQSEALFDLTETGRLTGIRPEGELFPEDARPQLTGGEHPVNAMIAFESRFRLPDYVILRLDKLSMRHSLETRTPLLDYRLAEFAAGLPVFLKANIEEDREKYICSEAYLRKGLLKADQAMRKKQPFTIPIAHWLANTGNRPEFVEEILSGDLIRRHGVLDPEMTAEIAGRVETAGVGPETLVSEADRLFAIVVFTLWYEAFFA